MKIQWISVRTTLQTPHFRGDRNRFVTAEIFRDQGSVSLTADVGTKTIHYIYDFGDNWHHVIKVEKIDDAFPLVPIPTRPPERASARS